MEFTAIHIEKILHILVDFVRHNISISKITKTKQNKDILHTSESIGVDVDRWLRLRH